MRRSVCVLIVLAAACLLAGCGNVTLQGDALNAAEQSTMDAYQAVTRASVDGQTPAYQVAYLTENFKQWRYFVQSARKDLNWGPKLTSETNSLPVATQPADSQPADSQPAVVP